MILVMGIYIANLESVFAGLEARIREPNKTPVVIHYVPIVLCKSRVIKEQKIMSVLGLNY
jgi:hypothetical protein